MLSKTHAGVHKQTYWARLKYSTYVGRNDSWRAGFTALFDPSHDAEIVSAPRRKKRGDHSSLPHVLKKPCVIEKKKQGGVITLLKQNFISVMKQKTFGVLYM